MDVFLRPYDESDVTDAYLAWFRDRDVTQWLQARNLSREDAVSFYRKGKESGLQHMYAICASDTGKHIGNLKIGPIKREDSVSDMVVLIGDKDYWGKGLATQAIRLGNRIAFEEHGIYKLAGGIMSGNIGSIKAYTKGGWVIEGRLRDHCVREERRYDKVLVACFRDAHKTE